MVRAGQSSSSRRYVNLWEARRINTYLARSASTSRLCHPVLHFSLLPPYYREQISYDLIEGGVDGSGFWVRSARSLRIALPLSRPATPP